ncbi:MAG: hypothetical protein FWC99_06380 [Coriobacteriia bacterium]|nr:hypothetical protein [Coriobacteriia bacterium]
MFKKKSSAPLRLTVWFLAGLALLLLLPAGVGLVWTPSCSSCHLVQSEKLEATVHSRNSCVDCHASEGAFGRIAFNQRVWYSMVIPIMPGQDPTRTVQNDSCLACHASVFDGSIVENRGLRINHEESAAGMRCSSCHGSVGHPGSTAWESRYAMESCMVCHSADLEGTTTASCDLCHVGPLDANQNPYSVFAVVHGPDMIYTHGVGDWNTCAPCHSQQMCVACHGEMVPHDSFIIRDHSQVANDPNNQCASCHQSQSFCDDCHGMEIPHPDDFLVHHAEETDRLGEESCYVCHLERDCSTCHDGHVHPGGPRMWFNPRMLNNP